MGTLQLIKSLVEIESPSGREQNIAKYVLNYLKNLGYDAFMEDLNVLVNPEKDFIVTTHLDTVKVQVPFSFNGEYAYGTGVCDAKASIAAILLALERISKLNFGVALFYDEENEGKGSESFCKRYRPKKAVVMEPTNLRIANVHYGGFEARITVEGKSAHGSAPQKGVNAIEKCLEFLAELKKLENVIVSVQQISGGSEEYVIPNKCEMRIEFSFKPEIKANDVLNMVREILSREARIELKDVFDGFLSGEVAKILKKAFIKAGIEAKFSEIVPWTDAVNLNMIGCDTVVFGPGELYRCHTQGERVRLKDIELTRNILVALNNLI